MSTEARDLITRMVAKDPGKRIKIKSIITHQWLNGMAIKEQGHKRRSTLHLPTQEIIPKAEDVKSSGNFGYNRGITMKKFPKLEIHKKKPIE